MSKEKNRGNREKKKPKQIKPKPAATSSASGASAVNRMFEKSNTSKAGK